MKKIYGNLRIVLKDEIIEHGFIEIEDNIITNIGTGDKEGSIDMHNLYLFPGFIDVHFHGSCGIDFMDASINDYQTISESLYEEGITTYLATTLTSDTTSLEKVCRNVKEAKKDNPSLLGIHLEGPYISKEKKGAQNENYIRDPDINELEHLIELSNNNIKYITLAPERNNAFPFIKRATELGITVSAGHTVASYDIVKEAIKYGLSNTTHTYNAMALEVVDAAIGFKSLYTELICDKIHVKEERIKYFYQAVGPSRLIVITDSLKAKHSSITKFELFGIECTKHDGAVYTNEGRLAGSILTMDQALRNMHDLVEPNLCNLSRICAYNAAKSLHLEDRGEIKVGLLADLVFLDENLKVIKVIKEGKEVLSS